MLLVDANVLLYAVDEDAPHHAVARDWLDAALAGSEQVGFDTVVMLAFLRIATRRDIFPNPLRAEEACAVLAAWQSAQIAVPVSPAPDHAALVCSLLATTGAAGNLVSDAHLAALALSYADASIVTFDRDFQRFPGVRVRLLGGG